MNNSMEQEGAVRVFVNGDDFGKMTFTVKTNFEVIFNEEEPKVNLSDILQPKVLLIDILQPIVKIENCVWLRDEL